MQELPVPDLVRASLVSTAFRAVAVGWLNRRCVLRLCEHTTFRAQHAFYMPGEIGKRTLVRYRTLPLRPYPALVLTLVSYADPIKLAPLLQHARTLHIVGLSHDAVYQLPAAVSRLSINCIKFANSDRMIGSLIHRVRLSDPFGSLRVLSLNVDWIGTEFDLGGIPLLRLTLSSRSGYCDWLHALYPKLPASLVALSIDMPEAVFGKNELVGMPTGITWLYLNAGAVWCDEYPADLHSLTIAGLFGGKGGHSGDFSKCVNLHTLALTSFLGTHLLLPASIVSLRLRAIKQTYISTPKNLCNPHHVLIDGPEKVLCLFVEERISCERCLRPLVRHGEECAPFTVRVLGEPFWDNHVRGLASTLSEGL